MLFEFDYGEHAVNTIVSRLTRFGSTQSTLALRIFSTKFFYNDMGPKVRVQRSNLSARLPAAQAQGPILCLPGKKALPATLWK